MAVNLKSPIHRIGGKFFLKDWLVQHIPKHTLYCEVFGGAGHVLFGKTPSRVEVLNDIDNNLVNFFQVIKDQENRRKLIETLRYMPYSRQVWQEMRDKIRGGDERVKSQKRQSIELRLKECFGLSDRQIAKELGVSDKTVGSVRKELESIAEIPQCSRQTSDGRIYPSQRQNQKTNITRAAEWFYLNRSCFGGDMQSGGFALPSTTGRNTAQSYANSIDTFHDIARRMQGVTVECLPYAECIQRYDSKDTLFFCDPPYLNAEGYYGKKNFAYDDHRDLANMLNMVKGQVMVTHYQNAFYDDLYKNWQNYTFESFKGSHKADAGEEKPVTTEVLYCNFSPGVKTRSLFSELLQ
ncbi:MAG: Methyltransferase [Candidatus Jettenia ecosi]|uniref:Methyltransferase n=1 Tax=Candidatus Jettenia ecosi TaxID=2494326 RepID=A0A533QMP2_9BACT|nr:MAG: Methyltransferase [Candidatus Jettenia ecosi]